MKSINPYLIFNGNAEEAFTFYKSVFGGNLNITRFKDMPGTETMPEEDQNKIAHVFLAIAGNDQILMASDAGTGHEATMSKNGNYYLSLTPQSAEEAKSVFDKLSDGGTIIMPLGETDWAELFAMFTDKFGIQWMINYGDK